MSEVKNVVNAAVENAPVILVTGEDAVAKAKDAIGNNSNISTDIAGIVDDTAKIADMLEPHLAPVTDKVAEILEFLATLFPGHNVPKAMNK